MTIQGFGNFDGNNASNVAGLLVYAHGSITLNRVTANMNFDPINGGGWGISLITVAGNATLVCSSAFGNGDISGGAGLYAITFGSLTLKGWFSYGIGDPDSWNSGALPIITPCP